MNLGKKPLLNLALLGIAIIVFAPTIFAGVNLKNLNFYVSYTDMIIIDGSQDIDIERTYNSKSIYSGLFGFGWGSDYETYLAFSPDGRIIVHENGGGALTAFNPVQLSLIHI